MKFEQEYEHLVDNLENLFWEWNNRSNVSLETRSYLRDLAEYTISRRCLPLEDANNRISWGIGLLKERIKLLRKDADSMEIAGETLRVWNEILEATQVPIIKWKSFAIERKL